MGVRAHIWLGTSAIVAVLVGAALYTLFQVNHLQGINTKMYRHPMAVSNAVIGIDGDIYKMTSLLYEAAFIKDEAGQQQRLAKIAEVEKKVAQEMAIIRDRFLGSTDMIDAVAVTLDQWPAVRDNVMHKARNESKSATLRALQRDLSGWVESTREPVKAIRDFAESKGIAFYENATQSANSAFQMALGLILASLAFSAAVSVWTIRSVMKPLGTEPATVQGLMRELAQGNLASTIELPPKDNNSLLFSIKELQHSLAQLVGVVRGNAESVSNTSAQIAQGNTDLSERTEQQNFSLQKTASSMEELSSTVTHSSENAARANDLAVEASQVASNGSEVVSQVVETMKEISESSSQITEITTVIDGIAFQTNLLALNAAVEAARAGEQGRGFAVVAGEVRTLAQRSAEAAKQINELINTSVERVDAGAKLVDKAGETMQRVMGSIHEVTAIMGEISRASEEQAIGVKQVGTEMNDMDNTTRQNAALVEESASATKELRGQSDRLLQAVDAFKLG